MKNIKKLWMISFIIIIAVIKGVKIYAPGYDEKYNQYPDAALVIFWVAFMIFVISSITLALTKNHSYS